MRLTDKNKIKELATLEKNKVLMTDTDYKELKLGQLENIEEKLGIDLITLFKALKNGLYWKDDNGKFYYFDLKGSVLDFNEKMIVDSPIDDVYGETFLLSEYGKTWALTKEELL